MAALISVDRSLRSSFTTQRSITHPALPRLRKLVSGELYVGWLAVVMQRLVQCVVVLYLVTHGLPIVSAAELRDLASAVCTCVLAQLRLT